MRCQHVDDDIQCRLDATRRVMVGCGDPPDPDQAGFAGTAYMVQVCKQHDPDPRLTQSRKEVALEPRSGLGHKVAMKNYLATAAPTGAAILAFLPGASAAAAVVPVVLYKASDAAAAVLVVVFGVLTVPPGAALGIGLKNKLRSW